MSQSDFVTRGQSLVSAGQFQEAVKVCRLGLLGRPTTVEGRIVLGQALLALKRYDEVLAEMRVALELDHGSQTAQLLKGEALLRKGDGHAAVEVLGKLRQQAASTPQVATLLGEAEQLVARATPGQAGAFAVDSSAGGSAFSGDQGTRSYPANEAKRIVASAAAATGMSDASEAGDSLGDYTRPTALSPGAAKRRSALEQAAESLDAHGSQTLPTVQPVPPAHTGTVEVDPDLDAVEVAGDDDLGDLAEPPDPETNGKRVLLPPRGAAAVATKRPAAGFKVPSTAGLGDHEVDVDVDEATSAGPLPVKKQSGPQLVPQVPHLAHLIASQPAGSLPLPAPSPVPLPGLLPMEAPAQSAYPVMSRDMIAHMQDAPHQHEAPRPMARMPHDDDFESFANLQAPDVSASPMPGAGEGMSPWSRPAMAESFGRAPLGEASPFGSEIAPISHPTGGVPAMPLSGESDASRSSRTGTRRARSPLSLALWIMIGAAVIGGGVFAGFQIREMRLDTQIVAARERSVDLAKADTWQGWLGARDSLHSIAQASPTPDNRAAAARARALLAYEFGDGLAETKALVEALGPPTSIDHDLALGYLALAQSDPSTARDAAERAQRAAPSDATASYIAGQAALLAGDVKAAITDLRRAMEREPRPLYAVGLARALGASAVWDEAIATIERAGDNPAALIAKGILMANSGRVSATQGMEIRAQLAKLIADAQRPPDQARPLSPTQVAFADLALAQVDFARNEVATARGDYRASLELGLDDQRFAEELCETLYAIGELEFARKAATRALEQWPASHRTRAALAEVWLALNNPSSAIDLFAQNPDAAGWPRGQVVRGRARLETGDLGGARSDFDAALKKLPGYEPALVSSAWLDLEAGDVAGARQRIEPAFESKSPKTPALIAVYGAILRAVNQPAARDKAKALLTPIVSSGPSPDIIRAQLELARLERDLGDLAAAKQAYAGASRTGNFEARLESGLVHIDNGDLRGGRDVLEQLLKDDGERPSAVVLLETARARLLTGAHAGATELLALADKAPGVLRWQLDRERARLALRRSDTAGAAQALVRALETCGGDPDTFLLAADTVSLDPKQTQLAAKLRALAPSRLRGKPEVDIIAGKLDLAATPPRQDEAERRYGNAREALMKQNATPRRRAQAEYGLAAVAYNRNDDPTATSRLDLVFIHDPSIYSAYLFAAEIARAKSPRKALELAQQAAAYNPDSVEAWRQVGTLAAQLNNRKLLSDAINRVGELVPGSDTLFQLQKLR